MSKLSNDVKARKEEKCLKAAGLGWSTVDKHFWVLDPSNRWSLTATLFSEMHYINGQSVFKNMIKLQMTHLWDRLNAGNTDSYFSMTSHWIKKVKAGIWKLKHALLRFVQMNTTHKGKHLSQALFKISEICKALQGQNGTCVQSQVVYTPQERSSSSWKELFKKLQHDVGLKKACQLLLDMKVIQLKEATALRAIELDLESERDLAKPS
ncbi:hypothetical protein EDD85DRAFT_790596 [Armillaria nabsnona]|nr:hypothetical protein EDD85DRAFT_790596 [Armillaria nabsnona]